MLIIIHDYNKKGIFHGLYIFEKVNNKGIIFFIENQKFTYSNTDYIKFKIDILKDYFGFDVYGFNFDEIYLKSNCIELFELILPIPLVK